MSLYLSRLRLEVCHPAVQRDVANIYDMHRTLMRAFPDEPDGGPGRVLFRLEDAKDGTLLLLVQSDIEPDWTRLQVPKGYLTSQPEKKEFDVDVRDGTQLAFRLVANPTMRTEQKRRAILMDEDLYTWLNRKAEAGGFSLVQAQITRRGKVHASKLGRDKMMLSLVQFDGILVVKDSAILRRTVQTGIGSGKGLGFGMLSLAPQR